MLVSIMLNVAEYVLLEYIYNKFQVRIYFKRTHSLEINSFPYCPKRKIPDLPQISRVLQNLLYSRG